MQSHLHANKESLTNELPVFLLGKNILMYVIVIVKQAKRERHNTGVTNLRIWDICLCISVCGYTYIILTLTLAILCLLGGWPCRHTPLNRILWIIDLYPCHQLFTPLWCLTYLIFLQKQLSLTNLGVHFLFEWEAEVSYLPLSNTQVTKVSLALVSSEQVCVRV